MTRKQYTSIIDNRERQKVRAENAILKHLARHGVSQSQTPTTHRNPTFEPASIGHGMHANPLYSPVPGGSSAYKERLNADRRNAMRAQMQKLYEMEAAQPSHSLSSPLPPRSPQSSLFHSLLSALPGSLQMRYLKHRGGY